jgi:hypothetical protein
LNAISEKAKGACRYLWRNPIDKCTEDIIGVGSLTGYIGEAMDEPPFSLAFVMVKESLSIPPYFFT